MTVITEQKLVPKLRFKEFGGEWKEETIDNIAQIIGGGTPETDKKEYWNGDIKWFTPTELKTKYLYDSKRKITKKGLNESSAKLLPKGTLLFSTRATVGDVAIALSECTTNQGFQSLIVDLETSNEFIYYWLTCNTKPFKRRASGSTFLEISKKEIKKVPIILPTLPEQEKIASFLGEVDKKIELLQKKKEALEQYKKGVMQKIFSQEIRFQKPDGTNYPDWEVKKLGEIFTRVTEKNKENNNNVLTISAQMGLVNQEEYFNRSVSASDVTGYYLLRKGDFAYNKSYSKGYPMGAIKRLTKYDKGVVSTLYICFRIKEGFYPEFFDHYFDAGNLNHELHKIAQEGARNHGLLNMSVVEFFNDLNIKTPSYEEQEVISQFLNEINNKLLSVTKQLENTQAFKKGLLQQMFV